MPAWTWAVKEVRRQRLEQISHIKVETSSALTSALGLKRKSEMQGPNLH